MAPALGRGSAPSLRERGLIVMRYGSLRAAALGNGLAQAVPDAAQCAYAPHARALVPRDSHTFCSMYLSL
ncbi:hypothetical protein NDU88_001721 [Pleurodeles waltl]|uniref:Uncharacterized protein n=1 Tax=Pleurodeles waltl TaxID=8319 RepID=A0AAV7Q7N8_PLEWA|nr:hypothetical protein NDU88_001721 [Pleurodeles waltl]